MPYGAYDRFALHAGMADAGFEAAIALDAVIGDSIVFTVMEPMVVFGLRLLCTLLTAYDTKVTDQIISLDHQPAYGSVTGRTELGTITVPDALAAGKVLYKNFTPKKVMPGEQLVFEIKQAGTGGVSIAGTVQPFLVVAPAPESPGNCLNLVASA
jgi:hypothetical protein